MLNVQPLLSCIINSYRLTSPAKQVGSQIDFDDNFDKLFKGLNKYFDKEDLGF